MQERALYFDIIFDLEDAKPIDFIGFLTTRKPQPALIKMAISTENYHAPV